MASLLHAIHATRVLDAATGTGHYAIELAKRGCEVFAFDTNDAMLDVAKKKAQGLDIAFRLGHLPQVPFDDLEVEIS